MHIYCRKELLLSTINTVLKASSTKTTMPILECILLTAKNNQLILLGNNLELAIESTVEADVSQEGQIALDARLFSDIMKRMPGDTIEIKVDEHGMAYILSEQSKFKIVGQPGDRFPTLPNVEKEKVCVLKQDVLKEMIRQTIFAVAQDETRPILTGEMLQIKNNTLNMVAVDGFRIAYRRANILNELEDFEVIIPGKTLNEIYKILSTEDKEIQIYFSDNHVLFDLGESKIVSRLLEGEFLRYEQIFSPDYETKILINRKNLLMSLERAALISREGKKNPIHIEFDADTMIITSNAELGASREEISTNLEGKEISIAFNPKYLLEALRVIDDEEIFIQFISPLTPCTICPKEGDHYKYLILPIRMNH